MSESIFVVSMHLIAEPTPGDALWSIEFERVIDAFYELEQGDPGLLDSAWSSTDRDDFALVEVEVTAHADSPEAAWARASAAVRCAIHMAGGRTLDQVGGGGVSASVAIDDIEVVDRHRLDLGDIDGLAASIATVGLLNPVTITASGRLIAGQRRLEACRSLGHTTIAVRVATSVTDAVAELAAERDENTCRKEMTPSERVALGKALEALEKPKAEERRREGNSRGGRGEVAVRANGDLPRYDTREVVAPAVGMSTATYSRAKQLVDAAEDEALPADQREAAREAVAEMDATGKVTPAYEKFKGHPVNRSDAPSRRPAVEPTAPPASDRSRAAVEARSRAIAELAALSCTSGQIAERLGIALTTVKSIAKRDGIDISADAVMGKVRKRIDPTRVARETVYALEGLATGVGYIADLMDQIDLEEAVAQEWAASLSDSLRALNRFSKQIKETTHVQQEA